MRAEHASNTIHLMLSFNKGYITPLLVLLTSIFESNKENTFCIHSVARVSDEDKDAIRKFVLNNGSEIFFYEVDNALVSSFVLPNNKDTHLTSDTYNRLFIPKLIPQAIKRILHIDIDTVVVGNLNEIYTVDMGTFPAAAVPDAGMPARPDLGIFSSNDYFNAGVLLINLEQWKQQEISEKTIEVVINYPEMIEGYVDQDALNFVLKNNWFKLDRRFNLMGMYSPKDLLIEQQDEYLQDKVIIHFNGPKPWNFLGDCDHRFAYLYHFYRTKSPIRNQRKYIDVEFSQKFVKKFAKKFVYARVLEIYLDSPVLGKLWRRLKGA